MHRGSLFGVEDLLEDCKQFRLGNFSISIDIDSLDEAIDLIRGDFMLAAHMIQSIIDQVEHFTALKCSTLVSIIFSKHSIHSLSKLIFGVCHLIITSFS